MRLDHVRVMLPVVVVEVLEQLALGYGCARAMDEVLENAVLHRGKVDRPAGTLNALLQGVHLDPGYAQGWVGGPLSAAYQRLHARDQLSEVEWLSEIIVGAGIQQLHDRSGFIACRENQYRGGHAACPQALQQG